MSLKKGATRIAVGLGAVILLLGSGTPAEAAGKWWVGGGLGMGFGDVRFTDLSAIVGYSFTPRWSAGTRLSYRNTTDDRFAKEVTQNDYGASLFARFRVKGPFFLQGEYEYLSYEFLRSDLSTERDDFTSVLLGGGAAHALNEHTTLFVSALYNFSYDDDDVRSPYDSPLIFRFGVGFRF